MAMLISNSKGCSEFGVNGIASSDELGSTNFCSGFCSALSMRHEDASSYPTYVKFASASNVCVRHH